MAFTGRGHKTAAMTAIARIVRGCKGVEARGPEPDKVLLRKEVERRMHCLEG